MQNTKTMDARTHDFCISYAEIFVRKTPMQMYPNVWHSLGFTIPIHIFCVP